MLTLAIRLLKKIDDEIMNGKVKSNFKHEKAENVSILVWNFSNISLVILI